MTYGVFLRIDSTGPWPVIVRPDAEFFDEDRRARWRYVVQTDSLDEAHWILAALQGKLDRGEL